MNIEVDVAGQLFPNPLTMAFTLLVTGVLFYFIYKLVWNPAREIIAKRQEYYDGKIKTADDLNKEAEDNLAKSKQAIIDADKLAQEIKASAKAEGESIKGDIVTKAQKQASDYIDKAKERMEKERKELEADINTQIVDVALAASEKLIASKDVKAQDREAIERLIEEFDHGSDK